MNKREHEAEHKLIAEAIVESWLDHARMLVHLASAHGLRVADVTNAGMAVLIVGHDAMHGCRVFAEAESALDPEAGLLQGLASMRGEPDGR